MVEDVVRGLLERNGADWLKDEEANLRFMLEAEIALGEVEGVHMVGQPTMSDGTMTVTCWVDEPIDDLFDADFIAYDVFARISKEFFCVERKIDGKSIRYPFVTGSNQRGHQGMLVMVGPHIDEFAERYQLRVMGDVRFHA